MTLDEILAEKKRCEECIEAVILRFHRETGQAVSGVTLRFVEFTPLDRAAEVQVLTSVKLDVRL